MAQTRHPQRPKKRLNRSPRDGLSVEVNEMRTRPRLQWSNGFQQAVHRCLGAHGLGWLNKGARQGGRDRARLERHEHRFFVAPMVLNGSRVKNLVERRFGCPVTVPTAEFVVGDAANSR